MKKQKIVLSLCPAAARQVSASELLQAALSEQTAKFHADKSNKTDFPKPAGVAR